MTQRRVSRVPVRGARSANTPPRRFRWSALVAVAAIGAAALTASVASPASAAVPPDGPAGDAFYTPPNPLPAGQPGDVIWKRKKSESAESTTYLVLYRSTNANGAPVAVSGQVIVPKNRVLPFAPIVGVAPGTTGVGDTCAVSRNDLLGAVFVPADLVKQGFALAVTDYEGLGTPGGHTYIVGRSEGRAVIDAVRAATRLGIGLSARSPVGFWGYSQGGGGAMWAGELAPTYGSELRVKGVAAGGIPANLNAVKDGLNGGLGFGFMLAAAFGLNSAYPELNLPKYLNAEGQKVFQKADTMCVVDLLGAGAFKKITDFTTTDPTLQPDWQIRLKENSLGSSPPKVPVFMYHGIVDEIIPYAQADALRAAYCKAGVKVTWSIQIGEHVTTLLSGAPEAVKYMTDRLKGVPASSNC